MRLTKERVKEVLILASKGNDYKVIKEITGISIKKIKDIIDKNKKDMPKELFKTERMKQIELFNDFERIMKSKISSSDIGKGLWNNLKTRHEIYKKNWEADTFVKFKFKPKYIAIAFLADFHIGHEGVDYNRLEHDLKILKKTKNMYSIFLGDAIDNFIDGDKHREAVINAITSPKDQLYMLKYTMEILGNPSQKILFVTKDNHVTHRLKKATGIDWSNKFWSDLNIFYGGEEVISEISLGNNTYKIAARHRYRGTSNIHLTAAAKNYLKNGNNADADIVALGHKHQAAMEVFNYRGKLRCAVQASTYKIYDPFSSRIGYEPSPIFMPVLILNPNKKDYIIATSVEEGAKLINSLNK